MLALRTLLHGRLFSRQTHLQTLILPRVSSVLSSSFSAGDGWDGEASGSSNGRNGETPPLPSDATDGLAGFEWGEIPSWSTGLTKEHFDGVAPVGRRQTAPQAPSSVSTQLATLKAMDEDDEILRMVEGENKKGKAFVDGWGDRMRETAALLKQVREPGVRGEYLKDSEKKEIYRLHKEDPETYTIERLAKDFRIMRQRVHAILWLKEMEEEEEKKLGQPLDDSIEILLDTFPEFFNSHDREFHVASLPYKPDFKVMPEDWDGNTKDPDEVHYEISKKEDDVLYEEFVQRLNFNKKKVKGEVKCHPYSRRRPDEGWNITVEKLGPQAKRGSGGGFKFVSLPDGSSRPLNEMEKMYLKRETPKKRKRIIAPFKH